MKIKFKCGCFFTNYIGMNGKENGGLSCCGLHEKPYQDLKGLGEVVIESIETDDINNPDWNLILPPKKD